MAKVATPKEILEIQRALASQVPGMMRVICKIVLKNGENEEHMSNLAQAYSESIVGSLVMSIVAEVQQRELSSIYETKEMSKVLLRNVLNSIDSTMVTMEGGKS